MIGLLRRGIPDITTPRLRLVAMTAAMLKVDEARTGSFALLAKLLSAEVTSEWPPENWEPHVLHFIQRQFEDEPRTQGWHRYVLLPKRDGSAPGSTLIGAVGAFPKFEGDAELGYSTLPSFQRRGYGTEAAKALVEWLLQQNGVRSVSAQSYEAVPESVKVMERCGMTFAGSGDDPGTLRYRRMRSSGQKANAPPIAVR